MRLFEKEIPRPLRLTKTQKFVLLTVYSDEDAASAFRQISIGGRKILTAADILNQLGVIELGQDSASITDYGHQLVKDEELVDEMGELTDRAREILDPEGTEEAPPGEEDGFGGTDLPPGDMDAPQLGNLEDMGAPQDMPTEGWQLLRSLYTLLNSN